MQYVGGKYRIRKPLAAPTTGSSMKAPEPVPPKVSYSRTVQYPTGQVVAFPDHLSLDEFNQAAKQAWQKIKEQ
jgi:hypothetical protein